MSFRKIQTIQVSERVFDLVCDKLDLYASEYGVKISGYLETFNNCREQGYVLTVSSCDYDNKEMTTGLFHTWAFECRNSDNIVISWQEEYPNNGMFSEETYRERRKYFGYDEIYNASEFMFNLIKEHFKKEFANVI